MFSFNTYAFNNSYIPTPTPQKHSGLLKEKASNGSEEDANLALVVDDDADRHCRNYEKFLPPPPPPLGLLGASEDEDEYAAAYAKHRQMRSIAKLPHTSRVRSGLVMSLK